MVPATTTRVPQHTAEHINQRIREHIEASIARYAAAGPEAIDRRLKELDREWDMERTLEANASTLALIGVVLGATVSSWWCCSLAWAFAPRPRSTKSAMR